MKILTFSKEILNSPAGTNLFPGIKYLSDDGYVALSAIEEEERHTGIRIVESVEPLTGIPDQWKHPSHAETLLVYNTGAIGDQLITTWAVRLIKKHNPKLIIDVVVRHDSANLWHNNADVRGVRLAPLPMQLIDQYDSVLFWDKVLWDVHDTNCYEHLAKLLELPFDPNTAQPNLKLFKEDESNTFTAIGRRDEESGIEMTKGHVVLGLHSRSSVRNLHSQQLVNLVSNISKWINGGVIYGVSNNGFGADVQQKLVDLQLPNYVPCHSNLNVRQIGVLCYYAGLVIAPDSMLIHLAASQNAPCVALMSTIAPELRTATYPLCESIFNFEACKFAPCNWKNEHFLQQFGNENKILPCYTPHRYSCNVTASITTTQILQAGERAAQKKMKFDGYKIPFLSR